LKLPDAFVCYLDTTVALPLLTHYALAKHRPRKLKSLYAKLPKLLARLTEEYFKHNP
jgi:deoxyhypusine synthase